MIFICRKCLNKAGKQSVWTERVRRAKHCGMRSWVGTCNVCRDTGECVTVSGNLFTEVCNALNPAEDDPDAMCSHPGHPSHYGDR